MDATPVSDDISMEARVHARVVVVVAVVAVVAVTVLVVVVFWRRRAAEDIFFWQVEARPVPARGAGIRAVSRGNCGFVCICKRSLPAGIAVALCRARFLPGTADHSSGWIGKQRRGGRRGGGYPPNACSRTRTHRPVSRRMNAALSKTRRDGY